MLDLDAVRAEFPALSSGYVFLDNAGGSQTLRRVVDRVRDYLLSTNVQLGASYAVSQTATERVLAARHTTARFIGAADPHEVVLGSSSTQLLSNLALAMESSFAPGDEVVVTTADHWANIGPWARLAKRGVVVKTWHIDPETQLLDERDLVPLLGKRTRLVAFTHVSNLLGSIHDVARLTRIVHEHGARVCVDGVAYAPHRAVDVAAWDVDYYVFSFYKVYGPHIAVMYGKREHLEALDTINHEFIGNELPYKLQPGNVNYELAHGLGGIYDYVDALGGKGAAFDAIAAHEEKLSGRLLSFLLATRGVRVWGAKAADRAFRVPTVSFSVDGASPESIVRAVDPHGIGIRHGDFYAKHLVRDLGLEPSGGVVRVSMVHYNTEAEMDRLLPVLEQAISGSRHRAGSADRA
jgi:cysteine desulfurase family protein (TIGR01976 family)